MIKWFLCNTAAATASWASVDLNRFLERTALEHWFRRTGRRAGGKRHPARCSRKTQDKFAIASMAKKFLHRCIGAHARVHMHFCGEYGSLLRIWDFVFKWSICMLILIVGIGFDCDFIIIIICFCFVWSWFSLFRVLSGCCLVIVYLGGGMSFELMYLYVGSGCSSRDYFYIYMYMFVVLRLT